MADAGASQRGRVCLVFCAATSHTRVRMSARRRKKTREQDVTGRYLAGDMDEDAVEHEQRFSDRNKNAQQEKILKTAAKRAAAEATASALGETDLESLPVGQVFQVYSLYCE